MKSGWSSLQANSVLLVARVGFADQGGAFFENCIASTRSQSILYNPSYKGLTVDALALGADEGRGRLR